MLILHPYAFHHIAVGKGKQKLFSPVQPGFLDLHRSQAHVRVFRLQLFTQGKRDIGHIIITGGQLAVHPVIQLCGAEALFPHPLHFHFQFFQRHGFDISPHVIPLVQRRL